MDVLLYREYICYNRRIDSHRCPKISMTFAQPNLTHAGVPLSPAAFSAWVARARPGQRLVYHRGLLLHERMPSSNALQPRDRVALVALAKRAMQAAEHGRVLLLQRRHGNSDYSYIAVKASGRAPARSVGAGTALLRTVTPPSTGPDHPATAKETSQCL